MFTVKNLEPFPVKYVEFDATEPSMCSLSGWAFAKDHCELCSQHRGLVSHGCHLMSHMFCGVTSIAMRGSNGADVFQNELCQFIADNRTEISAETQAFMATHCVYKTLSKFNKSLHEQFLAADELFLHCAAWFCNTHIRVHFGNKTWATVEAGHESLISVELACVGPSRNVLLEAAANADSLPCDGDDTAKEAVSQTDNDEISVLQCLQRVACVRVQRYKPTPLSVLHRHRIFRGKQLVILVEHLHKTPLSKRFPNHVFHGPRQENTPLSQRFPNHVFCGPSQEKTAISKRFPNHVFCGPQLQVCVKRVKTPAYPSAKVVAKCFYCVMCKAPYDTRSEVKTHCREEHGTFTCPFSFCAEMFTSEASMKKHCHVHARHNCTCKHCACVFQHRFALSRHMVQHEKKGKLQCKSCPLSYKRKQDLKEHVTTCHRDKNVFVCSQCDFARTSRHQVRQHEYGHRPNMLLCVSCGDKFTYPSQLSKHRQGCN